MLAVLFNQPIGSWGIVEILIMIVIVAACVGIVFVALKVFGVTIPSWVI